MEGATVDGLTFRKDRGKVLFVQPLRTGAPVSVAMVSRKSMLLPRISFVVPRLHVIRPAGDHRYADTPLM